MVNVKSIREKKVCSLLTNEIISKTIFKKRSTRPTHDFYSLLTLCPYGSTNYVNRHFFTIIDPRGRPQSRPVVITIFTHVVRPSVTKLQNAATITAGRDCGLAKWIIDDSCLVITYFHINNPFAQLHSDMRRFYMLVKMYSHQIEGAYAIRQCPGWITK